MPRVEGSHAGEAWPCGIGVALWSGRPPRMTLRRQVLLWSGAIMLLAVGSFGALALQIGTERDAVRETSRVREVVGASASVARLAVDLQTGTRGFIVTGEERFLAPQRAALAALPSQFPHLRYLVRDPRQRARVDAVEAEIEEYAGFSRRVVAIARRDRARAARIIAFGIGVDHLDAISEALAAFDETERAIAARSERDLRDAQTTTLVLSLVLLGAIAALLGAFAFVIVRRVVAPVSALAAAARDVTAGNLAVAVPAAGGGEVGHLVARFNVMTRTLAESVTQLESANRELETFAYSVSHDLRGPLRAVDGFAEALVDEYAGRLDDTARDYLGRIRAGAQRMGLLIDALLDLSRIGRAELARGRVDITALVHDLVADLRRAHPHRDVEVAVQPDIVADADPHLLRVVLQNLIGNAWKFTGDAAPARIEVGATHDRAPVEYFVRDNGAGFDMAYAAKLFSPFQRLHSQTEFPGSGVGLATVSRIVARHGGEISAEGRPGEGATFRFTLG